MSHLGFPEQLAILSFLLVFLLPWWRIFSKAGYPAWLSILMFVPVINVGLLFWFAFSHWPALRRNQ